jgi:anti-sigma B factor antagonist
MDQAVIKISTEKWRSWNIVKIEGKFVIKFIAEIRKAFEAVKDDPSPKIALDLSQTTHLDSSAMTIMLNFQNRLKEKNGGMALFGANEDILGIITIVGFDSFVPIYRTRQDFERSVAAGQN